MRTLSENGQYGFDKNGAHSTATGLRPIQVVGDLDLLRSFHFLIQAGDAGPVGLSLHVLEASIGCGPSGGMVQEGRHRQR